MGGGRVSVCKTQPVLDIRGRGRLERVSLLERLTVNQGQDMFNEIEHMRGMLRSIEERSSSRAHIRSGQATPTAGTEFSRNVSSPTEGAHRSPDSISILNNYSESILTASDHGGSRCLACCRT